MNQNFQVEGMTCSHCEQAVSRAVQALDPAARIEIDRAAGKVAIASELPREQLARAIAEQGYGVAA